MQFVAKRHILSFLCVTVDISCIALVLFTASLTNISADGVGASHKLLSDGRGENQSAQMKVVQGDYLASNRVLAPTLRLKPFSITGISADVAPASPDPLELPASCPFVFAGSLPLC